MNNTDKRENGQYFTTGNCFMLAPFKQWFEAIPNYSNITLIEPFAGSGNIPFLMKEAGYNNHWELYDIAPQNQDVQYRDSIEHCPTGECIITNPLI